MSADVLLNALICAHPRDLRLKVSRLHALPPFRLLASSSGFRRRRRRRRTGMSALLLSALRIFHRDLALDQQAAGSAAGIVDLHPRRGRQHPRHDFAHIASLASFAFIPFTLVESRAWVHDSCALRGSGTCSRLRSLSIGVAQDLRVSRSASWRREPNACKR